MKRQIFILLLLIMTSLIISCTNSGASDIQVPITETAESPTKTTIALVMKTLTNPFFVEMEKGARQAETEFDIQLIVKTAAQETSIEQQIEIVDELIRQQVDAIVIAPGDSLELIPVLKKAQDAGIIVINIDNRLDRDYSQSLGLENVPFISVDNQQGAYLSAKYISDLITTPTKAVVIEGIRSAQNAEDRKTGALQAFDENANITLVATETANWKIDEGYEVTKSLFAAEPDIGAIFCANDMMALGALKYLEENGKSDVLVAAFDALREAREAIRAGTLAVTIDQQAATQGYMGVQYAVQALAGESLPAETLVDVLVINASNAE